MVSLRICSSNWIMSVVVCVFFFTSLLGQTIHFKGVPYVPEDVPDPSEK